MIDRVLVVCEGNICRSPLACAMLAASFPDIRFSSAGTHALVGESADPHVLEMARERGVSLCDHVATALTGHEVNSADLILTMTTAQREYIECVWPSSRGKVYRLITHVASDIRVVRFPRISRRASFEARRVFLFAHLVRRCAF